MAPQIEAVIDVGYGDGGKGQFVHELSDPDALVIRFNGGAQAGHTVVDRHGARHVFSHFGSGTLQGASTFLSKDFVCHPDAFAKELKELMKILAHPPHVAVSPNAPITTPYDVILNILAERRRGEGKHGSVCMGFGETIERTNRGPKLIYRDLEHNWKPILGHIADNWVPLRMAELGLDYDNDCAEFEDTLKGASTLDTFVQSCEEFVCWTGCMDDNALYRMAGQYSKLIFEGAQGLLLDQDFGTFPHVTRSNTGMRNVSQMIGRNARVRVNYVTRSYTTRHGAGPLPWEADRPDWLVDKTNRDDGVQGMLRYSPLNLVEMHRALGYDRRYHGPGTSTRMVISWMDVTSDTVPVIVPHYAYYQGRATDWNRPMFLDELDNLVSDGLVLRAGPDADYTYS